MSFFNHSIIIVGFECHQTKVVHLNMLVQGQNLWIHLLIDWCLKPTSAVFQLYHELLDRNYFIEFVVCRLCSSLG